MTLVSELARPVRNEIYWPRDGRDCLFRHQSIALPTQDNPSAMTAASGAQQLRSRRPLSATQPGAADDEERQVGSAEGRPAKRQRAAKTAAQAVLQLAEAVEAAEEEAEEAISLPPTASAARLRQRRQRVLVDTHRGVPAAAGTQRPALEQVDNEYERQRLERIRRNELMLQRLGVQQAAAGVAAASAAEQQAGQPFVRRAVVGRRERRLPPPSLALPVRASKRQRGQRPLTQEEAVAAAAEELGAGGPLDNATASEQGAWKLGHGRGAPVGAPLPHACLPLTQTFVWHCCIGIAQSMAHCCTQSNTLS